ncbi:MAG TPA: Gfo/Idh/MocA family oxidoreductase [Burkholderiaceae bacterium]|nr:Gfo/Idh/MocA family oxidoreductase [Burkholderiaceae bacterium]
MIGDVLIHPLDVLRWLLGPLHVLAARAGRLCPSIRGDDHAVILLGMRTGWGVLDGSYVAPGAPATPSDRLELLGTHGCARLQGDTLRIDGSRAANERFDLDAGYGASYAAAIAHFADALARGTPFETDPFDHVQTLALVDEAYRAAGTNGARTR